MNFLFLAACYVNRSVLLRITYTCVCKLKFACFARKRIVIISSIVHWRYLDRFVINEHFYLKKQKQSGSWHQIRSKRKLCDWIFRSASIQKRFQMQTKVGFLNELVNANMARFDAIIDKIAFNMYVISHPAHSVHVVRTTRWQFNFSRIKWICVNL